MAPREPHKRMLRAALGIIALCLVGLIVTAQQEPVTELCSMSLLLNTRQEVDWSALCAGAQVAANEHDVDLSIVTLSADNDAGEQASLLERETARGAQAILLCAADRRGARGAGGALRSAGRDREHRAGRRRRRACARARSLCPRPAAWQRDHHPTPGAAIPSCSPCPRTAAAAAYSAPKCA